VRKAAFAFHATNAGYVNLVCGVIVQAKELSVAWATA
jgi:hypothetical protein